MAKKTFEMKLAPRKYKVGDWVTIPMRPQRALAQIIEYRGPFGGGGEHVYRFRYDSGYGEPVETELKESWLEPAEAPSTGQAASRSG